MAEYIEREAFIAHIRKEAEGLKTEVPMDIVIEGVANEAKAFPSADVQPVRHGRWQITECYPHNVYCSECHARCAQTHWAVWEDGSLPRAYCPNCGAKMDGGDTSERQAMAVQSQND